ncbi:MAG: TonB-dependent receptor [Bryobacteraceae bacterium]
MFRDFRAGNAETRSNPQLQAEKMFGAEVGVDLVGETARFGVTLYRHALEQIITNVTLSSTPQLIVRQRQNAASALARGVDATAEARWRNFRGEVGYLYSSSAFVTGERVPQVPKHSGSAQLTFSKAGTIISGGMRSYSLQFEDDRNQFILPGFANLQLTARRELARGFSAMAAVENLLGREYLVGFSPTPLIGSPRLWRVGLRWEGRVR